MEENNEKQAQLYEVRSYLSCLKQGMRLPTQNILLLMKYLYPSFIAWGITACLCGLFFNQLSVALVQWWNATEPVVLNLPFFVLLGLGILILLSASLNLGQLMHLISRYGGSGVLPVVSVMKEGKSVFDMSIRALTWIVIGVLLSVAVIFVAFKGIGILNVWTWVVLSLFILVFWVPYTMVGWDYMLGHSASFFSSLRKFKEGYQFWVAFFILLLCGGLVAGILTVISWLPTGVLAYSGYLSEMTIMQGDPTDLPAYIPGLVVVFFVVSFLLASLFQWLLVFPLSFLYGNLKKKKKEKEAFEEESKKLDEIPATVVGTFRK